LCSSTTLAWLLASISPCSAKHHQSLFRHTPKTLLIIIE